MKVYTLMLPYLILGGCVAYGGGSKLLTHLPVASQVQTSKIELSVSCPKQKEGWQQLAGGKCGYDYSLPALRDAGFTILSNENSQKCDVQFGKWLEKGNFNLSYLFFLTLFSVGIIPSWHSNDVLYEAEIRKDNRLVKILEYKNSYVVIYGLIAVPLSFLPGSVPLYGRGVDMDRDKEVLANIQNNLIEALKDPATGCW